MKKSAVLLTALIFSLSLCVCAFAEEKLQIDKDVKEGQFKSTDTEVEKEALEEDKTELDTSEAPSAESSPAMPEAANKSVYFGDVKLFAEYSALNMDKFNKTASGNSMQKLSSAVVLGLDLGYKMSEMVSVGPRVEFVKALGSGTDTLFTTDASLIPVMAGFKTFFYAPDISSVFSLGAFAGYSWAFGKIAERNGVNGQSPASSDLSGSAFAADVDASANYMLNSTLSFGLNLGYRYSDIQKITLSGPLGTTGGDLSMDFGGFNFGLNVNMNY